MNRSAIYVQYRDGSKPKGKKVVLGLPSGMSKPAFTDRDGMAIVEHASKGKADVYVAGRRQGSFRAPGKFVVIL